MTSNYSRRRFLWGCTKLSFVGAVGLKLSGCGEEAAVATCVNEELLEPSKLSMRESLNYIAVSTDSDKQCHNCSYFTGSGPDQCGSCTIFAGPADYTGYCNSWTESA